LRRIDGQGVDLPTISKAIALTEYRQSNRHATEEREFVEENGEFGAGTPIAHGDGGKSRSSLRDYSRSTVFSSPNFSTR
jgi:hypothetical protein